MTDSKTAKTEDNTIEPPSKGVVAIRSAGLGFFFACLFSNGADYFFRVFIDQRHRVVGESARGF